MRNQSHTSVPATIKVTTISNVDLSQLVVADFGAGVWLPSIKLPAAFGAKALPETAAGAAACAAALCFVSGLAAAAGALASDFAATRFAAGFFATACFLPPTGC